MRCFCRFVSTLGCVFAAGAWADAPAINPLTASFNARTSSDLTGALTVGLSGGAALDVVVATDGAYSNVHARFSENFTEAGQRQFALSGVTPGLKYYVRAIATTADAATTNTTTVTAPAGFEDMCYKPPENQTDYPWTWAQYWFSVPGSNKGLGYLPSLGDDVLLYSSKNVNVPLRVAEGVHATTRNLRFGNASYGGGNPQWFVVEAGATMTNAGFVIVGGNSETSDTAGHLFISGEWTALTNFYLGRSKRTSTLTVNEGGRFINDNLMPDDANADNGNEFIIGDRGVSVDNIVTNRGEMNLLDLHAGSTHVRARGVFENYGTLNLKRKMTLGRIGYGYFHHHKGATLNKANLHDKPVIIAHGEASNATLELDDDVTFPGTLQMSNKGAAKSRLILNDATLTVSNRVEVCQGIGASASIELNGDSCLKLTRNADHTLRFGNASNTFSRLTLKGHSRLDGVTYLRIPQTEGATGVVEFLESSCLTNCTKRSIIMAEDRQTNAKLVIGDNAFVGPLTNLSVCVLREVPRAVVEMRGGTLGFVGGEAGWSLFLGNRGASQVTGRITGWGRIKRTGTSAQMVRMTPYGQVIADGEGELRDLHFGNVRTVGYSDDAKPNTTGSNGWYAVRQGRLVYPRIQEINGASHRTIGDYPNRGEPMLVNSLRFLMDSYPSTANYHAYAELYAADRTDIPSGLPLRAKHLVKGVWRLGFSSGDGLAETPVPVSFSGLTLQIRHDVKGVPADYKMDVWHHDGTANGVWSQVMRSTPVNLAKPLLQTTEKISPSSEAWNAGWFAVVARPVSKGMTLLLR